MGKLAPTSIKYLVKATMKAEGLVEKPDVIGAVFGQTEGLLGADLNLRELQQTGRIGRIEVNLTSKGDKSEGEIIIPSSLDSTETSLIAASLETIERVGPCKAKIKVTGVDDMRSEKRKYVIEKAKDILRDLVSKGVPDVNEISEEIKEAVRSDEITSYQGLPCGPNVLDSDEMIIVEGRADVINLLKFGIRNAIAIEGSSIPDVIKELSKEKAATAFVDGDRGGELNLKSLIETAQLDFIAIAPKGMEVEELSRKEIFKCLREKVPAGSFKFPNFGRENRGKHERKGPRKEEKRSFSRKPKITTDQRNLFSKTLRDLVGKRAACIFDSRNELLGKVPTTELINTLRTMDSPFAIVFDGIIDRKLEMVAVSKGVKYLVGMEMEADLREGPVAVLTKKDLA